MTRGPALACLCVLVGACAPVPVPVSNPTTVSFTYADWATVDHFEGGYFAVPSNADGRCNLSGTPMAQPVTIDDLGNPLTGTSGSTLLRARPLGCYAYRVRAFDRSGLVSSWGAPSGLFELRTP